LVVIVGAAAVLVGQVDAQRKGAGDLPLEHHRLCRLLRQLGDELAKARRILGGEAKAVERGGVSLLGRGQIAGVKVGQLIHKIGRGGVEIDPILVLHQSRHPLGELDHHVLVKDALGELHPGGDLWRAGEH